MNDDTPNQDQDRTVDTSATVRGSLSRVFLQASSNGEKPKIEAFLEQVDDVERGVQLKELLAIEVVSRRKRGESPSADEYRGRFPEHRGLIDGFFAADTVEQMGDTERGEADAVHVTVDFSSESLQTAARSNRPDANQKILRRFGDYELLEEIARGGMGVVYRARDLSLDRQVALKMILTGQLASATEVERFYAEARAAANLEHPGILPIYEINQRDDHHFFTMALVEGGSLADELRDGPLAPRRAAELICEVADAVHYGHEHGIVHRDLKPANILLDAHGKPKVTDFGLAKQIGGDSGMTATGQILGTPSYMPPEQASGKISEVDARSDVYALGSLLYAVLVGRPPFEGASPVDVLQQVLGKEPTGPRKLNPRLPLDLEIICLRCLEKEPRRRFQTAAEVATS